MANPLLLVLIAIVGGVVVAIQAQMIGTMDQILGTKESVFITYGSGGLLIGLLLLLWRGGNLAVWYTVPWYAFGAGVMGLIIIAAISYNIPRLGTVPTFTLMVAAQFISGALIDHFGILGAPARPLSFTQMVGVLILLLGVWLIMRQ